VGDCIIRAIAIATEKPYGEVYQALHATKRRYLYHQYLVSLGWGHTPIKGRKVCLSPEQLPSGRLVVELNKHPVAVIDGIIHDTGDCSQTKRYVSGYFRKHSVGQGFVLIGEDIA